MFEKTLALKTKKVANILTHKKWLNNFYLAGGTALALHFGHRTSVDLDFFTELPINTADLIKKLSSCGKFELINQAENTIEGILDGVKVSFMTYPYALLLPLVPYNGYYLANTLDIALMKLGAIAGRNTRKDFIDLYVFLHKEGVSLAELLNFLPKKYQGVQYDRYHLYKALVYFADADKEPMPKMFSKITWKKVKEFFLKEINQIS